ncbi:T9SS type A sorting domain-containing protein [candidate division WOR-3 bacterium]|nr:T9SS type A sorting domain-containing protein [candidate division WOR-3 bacterium]
MIRRITLLGFVASAALLATKIEVPVKPFESRMSDPYYQSLLERSAITPTRVNAAAMEYLQARVDVPDTLRVLAIRIEFPTDDDSTTWGDGRMDLKGYGSPSDGLYYDPPHDRTFFANQMQGLRNFYLLNSRGRLVIEYDVYPKEPFAAYKVPQKMAYYGDTSNLDRGLTLFMRDALLAADKDPDIDFSDYQFKTLDTTFDMIVIFHAGSTLQSSYSFGYVSDLASATVTPGALEAYTGLPYALVNENVRVSTASILPESPRVEGYMVGLPGLLYHEFTHLLGGYDLYDVEYNTQGMGSWALMGGGGWLGYPPGQIPSIHDPYHRYMFGWEDPIIVTRDTTLTLYSAEFDTLGIDKWQQGERPTLIMVPIRIDSSRGNEMYREYFLIENRQSTVVGPDSILVVDVKDGVPIWVEDGEYDAFQPGAGVIIWHVDEDVVDDWGYANYINVWTPFGMHNAVDMEEADGIQDYELLYYETSGTYATEGSAFDPFFATGGNPSFGPETNPSSEGYYGETGISVTVLDTADTAMRVEITFDNKMHGFPKEAVYLDAVTSVQSIDLNNDGQKELLVIGASYEEGENRLGFAWEADGSAYGSVDNPMLIAFNDQIAGPAATGDVDSDGLVEVVIAGANGTISAYDADNLVSGFATQKQGFPVQLEGRNFTAPMLCDLDGNGSLEILAADEYGTIYAYDYQGELLDGFPIEIGEEIRPGFALLDETQATFVLLSSAGRLYAFDGEGETLEGFPVDLGEGAAPCLVPPMVADLDADGEREIICLVSEYGNYRYFLVETDGTVKYSSSRVFPSPISAPALADIDADGLPEVIFASANGLWALNANGSSATDFPVVFPDTYTELEFVEISGYLYPLEVTYGFSFSTSPVVGDLNGDKEPEIAVAAPNHGVYLVKPGDREPYRTLYTREAANSTALTLADLDSDQKLELIAGANSGKVHVWRMNGSEVLWGQWMHDVANTGLVTEGFNAQEPPSSMLNEIYVYPNPASNNAYLHALLGDIENLKVQLIDISGKLLKTVEPSFDPNTVNDIGLEELLEGTVPGLYIVRVEALMADQQAVELYKLGVIR